MWVAGEMGQTFRIFFAFAVTGKNTYEVYILSIYLCFLAAFLEYGVHSVLCSYLQEAVTCIKSRQRQ